MELPLVKEKGNKMDIKKMKAKARKSLKGNYLTIILAFLIYMIFNSICFVVANIIKESAMSVFLQLIVTGLIYMGFLQIIIKVARGKKAKVEELFTRTDLFWRCMALTIVFLFINVICGLLEYTAVNSLSVFLSYQAELNILLSSFMIVIGIILSIVIAVFWIVIMLYFSQSYLILYDNEEMPLKEIFEKSMDMMDGHKIDYIMLCLSFIGWIILGIFTFGILYFWLIPYIYVSLVNFYDEIKEGSK